MMEMLNAGLLEAIVVDDWKAKLWAQVLPKMKVHADRRVRDGRADRLGDPQGQPEARGDPERVLHELRQEAGRARGAPEAVLQAGSSS